MIQAQCSNKLGNRYVMTQVEGVFAGMCCRLNMGSVDGFGTR